MNTKWRLQKFTLGNRHHVSAFHWAHGRSHALWRYRCPCRYGAFGKVVECCGCSLQLVDCQRWIGKSTNFYKFIVKNFSSFSESVQIFSLLSFVNGKIDQDYKKTALSTYYRLSELKTCETINRFLWNLVWMVRNWRQSLF
jgi:hypothetical protein